MRNPDKRPPLKKFPKEPRGYVGLILSIEQHNESPLSRATIIIDAVQANFDPALVNEPVRTWDRQNLALLRIMTTAKRFSKMASLESPDDAEGEEDLAGRWVDIQLVPAGKISGPRAQVCRLGENGFEELENFTVATITQFGSEPEEPRSLSAAAGSGAVLASKLAKRRGLPGTKIETTASNHALLRLARSICKSDFEKVIIHDVGHASFTTLIGSSGKAIMHFDAGWPIPFNAKTCPPTDPAPKFAEMVFLSHWDWDHLHGYHRWKLLQKSFWIVPDQPLGPNAEFVVEELKAAHRLIRIPPIPSKEYSFGPLTLGQANPMAVSGKSKRRNNSGLVISVRLANGKTALMTGDADYVAIQPSVLRRVNLLVVPHHGAEVLGKIPVPHIGPSPLAVVSMGAGNCYQHPSVPNIERHQNAGWGTISFTSVPPTTIGYAHVARGDKTLA
ncbi:hypothetical protein [Thioclava sp. DLFJ4-1]|uniref:hypothetical protein n=1 Tax=Thioclava sp. DLFJ4-1 TaxID=1915313 RepID=UPI00117F27E6|nr:hypothetical protein [Thioclava sp. DLFJ4-1]